MLFCDHVNHDCIILTVTPPRVTSLDSVQSCTANVKRSTSNDIRNIDIAFCETKLYSSKADKGELVEVMHIVAIVQSPTHRRELSADDGLLQKPTAIFV